MHDIIYIHLDTISNSILTKGITAQDFYQSLTHLPQYLLLLNTDSEEGEFESHTALPVIKGKEAVRRYLSAKQREKEAPCWIDFSDLHLIKQLTPIEISELLYFGHMKHHLHAPFFYKLQNDYVYLTLNAAVNKLYYRHLEDFYHLLAYKIRQELWQRCKERQWWFKRDIVITEPDLSVLTQLKEVWQEGVVLNFRQVQMDESWIRLPIFIVEDRLRNVDELTYTDNEKIADLSYHRPSRTWSSHLYIGEE